MPYDDRSPKPFILRIVVPYGDPEGIRTIDDPNWTGKGVVFPRSEWGKAQERPELEKAGVYILSGTNLQATDDDLPSIYIGQTDGIKNRIDKHSKDKPFWDKAIAFVSNELNRAHITWLESVLVQRAKEINRCRLENNNEPHVPNLGEADKIVAENFLNKILQILPLVGLPIFEKPRVFNSAESTDLSTQGHTPTSARTPVADEQIQEADTIIVSSDYIGIQTVFLRKKCWHAIRIAGGKLNKIKYIAVYEKAPEKAINYYAEVEHIESYGAEGKYKVIFSDSGAQEIGPIRLGDNPSLGIQSPRYTTFAKLQEATELADLFN